MNKTMGWLNGTADAGETSDTQSSRSTSPNHDLTNLNNSSKTTATQNQNQLLSKLSTMEAQHMAQLHELTSQMAERELAQKEDSKNKEMELQQIENRAVMVERRIRERDGQMSGLKEEKAGCLRQIADLKNQLYQLQFEVEETTSDKATAAHEHQAQLTSANRNLSDAKRALDDALQSQVDALTNATNLEKENNELKKQLKANRGENDAEVSGMQRQLAELQSANARLTTQIAEETANKSKSLQMNSQEITNLRGQLRSRDEAIQSLQGRVESGQEDMTALEAELDELRGDLNKKDGESQKDLSEMRKENRELSTIVEKQNKALVDMTAKWEGQRKGFDEQRTLSQRQGEEIDYLKSALQEGELEKEASLVRSNSISEINHSRVTTLEVELQTMNEKNDELTAALNEAMEDIHTMNEKNDELASGLNEAMEEIEDLQADVVFKEGKIASLEKEIEEASSLLETQSQARVVSDDESSQHSQPQLLTPPASTEKRGSGNFARLRQEINKVHRERSQLETDHALQISLIKTTKDCDIAKLEKDLAEVRSNLKESNKSAKTLKTSIAELEAAKISLEDELEKTREVMDQLDAEEDREMEEMKQKVHDLQLTNDKLQYEIEKLTVELKKKEREIAEREICEGEELREARQALIALDKERRSPSIDQGEVDEKNKKNKAELNALNDQLTVCKEQVKAGEAKLNRTAREKEMIISDLRCELASKVKYASDLCDDLETLQLSVERGPSKRNYGMSIDPEWHEPDTISKLKVQITTLSKEKRMVEGELRSKIDARDATIATLVLSTSNLEGTIIDMKSEVSLLQSLVDSKSSSDSVASQERKELDANRRKEVEHLHDRTHDLTIELKQTKRKLQAVTEGLECAKSQLAETGAMPDVQDIAGRLVISEQAQKMLKTENSDKLKERDAAIANLLQSVQANEGVIVNLRADVEGFKQKYKDSLGENRRLQHESEIFAAQIIDQDEEFESLNASLKDKSGEIVSLKREIASSSADVRNVKTLERQLDELRQEKRHNTSRINELEVELRDMDMKKAHEDGFELEKLKLELQNAKDAKVATEERLNKQIDSLRKLRNHAVEDFESKLRERESQISSLELELLELREKVDDDFDDIFLDEKPGGEGGVSKKELLDERDMLLVKIEALGEEIESLRTAAVKSHRAAGDDSQQLAELKNKLAVSEQLKGELEKDRSRFNSSKDRDMDRLHRQLQEAKEAQTAREMEQLSLLKKLEAENTDIRDEFRVRMKEKNTKIVALEQTLSAQEQVVGNMSSEMDQLQNGMEKISVQRRAEIEEMQQELMDYTSKSTRLEREVMALSMKLDDKKLKHRTEVAKLRERIATLESESERIVRRPSHDDKRRENELEKKIDHLKWLNSSLKDEIEKLKDKVDALKKKAAAASAGNAKKDEGLSSSKKNNDKWRNVALQEQVAVLSQRVIELEEAAVSSAATEQSSSKGYSQSPRPSILHSPVMRSSLDAGNSSTQRSTPKSALRVSTYDADNQANHDLLSNSDKDDGVLGNSSRSAPPALPRPNAGSSTPRSGMEKSKSTKSSSGFRFRKRSSSRAKDRSSPASSSKYDDASNSTMNYDF